MDKILVPVDGSPSSDGAVCAIIKSIQEGAALEVHLLNVQLPLPGTVTAFITRQEAQAHHEEEGRQALQTAIELLEQAGIPYHTHIVVGQPATSIADCADKMQVQGIVMGSERRGRWSGLRLSDITAEVMHRATVPVEVIPLPRKEK